jgi:membrane protease YdiL (CAAX protease family)
VQTKNAVTEPSSGVEQASPQQIASRKHLAGFLLIGAGIVVLGVLAQHAPVGAGGASPRQLGQHGQAIHLYLTAILMDWALLYYCWVGVHHVGGDLGTLSGGLWSSWRSIAIDLAIALPFWLIWEGTAYGVPWLLGASKAKSVDSLLPQSVLEIVIWIVTSVTAGICEEMAFRGYLQRQLHALTGGVVMAVLGQGIVFGLFHAYQGWKSVIVISVLGVMYGVLAVWRRNLRANIIVHAWTDVWSGWLKFVVWR